MKGWSIRGQKADAVWNVLHDCWNDYVDGREADIQAIDPVFRFLVGPLSDWKLEVGQAGVDEGIIHAECNLELRDMPSFLKHSTSKQRSFHSDSSVIPCGTGMDCTSSF